MSRLKHGWDMLGHSEIVFGDSGTMRSFRDSGIFWTTQTMNRTTLELKSRIHVLTCFDYILKIPQHPESKI